MSLERLDLKTAPNIREWNHQSAILCGHFSGAFGLQDAINRELLEQLDSFQSLARPILDKGFSDYMRILLDAQREMDTVRDDIKRGIQLNE